MTGPSLAQVLANGHGIERSFCCPVHGDSTPSASVNTIKMVWVCYACGAHGKVDGEDLLTDIDFAAFRRQLQKQLADVEPKPESWLKIYESAHPYWRTRFAEATIEHFSLGHDFEANAATYPLRNNSGDVIGVVRRPLEGTGPRYMYPYGIDIGRLLFNVHEITSDYLVMVEGATDAMAAWEVGVQAVAIYGSRLSRPQSDLIRQLDPKVILCAYDQDEAGERAARQTLWRLPEYPVSRVEWHSAKDVNALIPSVREKILHEAIENFGLKP